MQSAVVYDVGYDSTMMKKWKNMVTVQLLAAIKEKNLARHRLLKKCQVCEAQCHIHA